MRSISEAQRTGFEQVIDGGLLHKGRNSGVGHADGQIEARAQTGEKHEVRAQTVVRRSDLVPAAAVSHARGHHPPWTRRCLESDLVGASSVWGVSFVVADGESRTSSK